MFYKPITIELSSTFIVYPCPGVEKLIPRSKISEHIKKVDSKIEKKGEYQIVILWDENNNIMTDVWIYDKIESWGSGPLVDVKIFRDYEEEKNIGVGAGNGMVLLGIEEQHRWTCKNLQEYLKTRPQLPEKITANKEY